MRKISFILSLIAGMACSAFAQADPDRQVIAKFSDAGIQVGNQKLNRINPRVDQELLDGTLKVYRVPAGVSREDYREALMNTGAFEFVEDNIICSPAAAPNDPSFGTQWYLGMISAPQAWDFTEGSPSMIVAVVDSGVALSHPDLTGQLVLGYNTISGQTQAAGGNLSDIHSTGHGTRCMGIAVAKGNNGIGVSGVGWNLKGMPVRVSDLTTGNTPLSELIEGVEWAATNGARVISVSYTGIAGSAVETAGQFCRARNAQLVWAAGNENTDLSTFDHKSVIIVGGTDQNDAKISISNYGKAVDIFAPAASIFTLNKAGGYGNTPNGTSFATPQVAAAFAMIWSANSTLSQDEVARRLFLRARDLGPVGNDEYWGNGRLNMGTSVEWPTRQYSLKREISIPGWLSTRLVDISENGEWVLGFVNNLTSLNKPFILGPSGYVVLDTPNFIRLDGQINNSGSAALSADQYSGGWTGRYSPADGLTYFSLNQFSPGQSNVYGINSSGVLVGSEQGLFPNTTRRSFISTGANSYTALTSTVNGVIFNGRALDATAVNDQGWFTGAEGWNHESGAWFSDNLLTIVSLPALTSPVEARPAAINSYGEIVGTTRWGWNFYPQIGYWNALEPSQSRLIDPSGNGDGTDINDRGEIIGFAYSGYSMRIFNSVTNAPINSLYLGPSGTAVAPFSWLQPLAPVAQPDAAPVAARWTGVSDIATSVVYPSGAFKIHVITPTDVPAAQVNLGQLGENPSYVGTIPPVVAVQFRTPDNVDIGGPINLNYNSQTGRTPLTLPPGQSSPFRLYLKQPGFLGRLYPPLDQPALAPDAFSTPMLELYQGDCDNDNEVGPGDFEIVVSNFGSIVGDPGVDGSGDVDGDGEVGPGDFEIIVENFGLAGDL